MEEESQDNKLCDARNSFDEATVAELERLRTLLTGVETRELARQGSVAHAHSSLEPRIKMLHRQRAELQEQMALLGDDDKARANLQKPISVINGQLEAQETRLESALKFLRGEKLRLDTERQTLERQIADVERLLL